MADEVILSIIADDRPGLVQRIAETVTEFGGNWIDSSMARLGGQFAGIVRVEIPSETASTFRSRLTSLTSEGIEVYQRTGTPVAARTTTGHRASFELTGGDHPGIVRDISRALANHGVSIEGLRTEVFVGSMSGNALFSAKAEIIIPEGLDEAKLKAELEDIAQDIMVDIHFTEPS